MKCYISIIMCLITFLNAQSKDLNTNFLEIIRGKLNIKISSDTKKYYAEIDYSDGSRRIDGWFDKQIIPLLLTIDNFQKKNDVKGNVAEIGVWQGRSFIPLMHLIRQNERAAAIDCFELYQFNLDNSGGNLPQLFELFFNNVKTYCSNIDALRVIKGNSSQFSSQDYLNKMENGMGFRIFSIDGCHEAQPTAIDIKNAYECLVPGGVILIDDYFNSCWPGVSEGINAFMKENPNRLKPFFIGWNKIFFAQTEYANAYYETLKKLFAPKDLSIKKFFDVPTLIYDPKP